MVRLRLVKVSGDHTPQSTRTPPDASTVVMCEVVIRNDIILFHLLLTYCTTFIKKKLIMRVQVAGADMLTRIKLCE